MFFTVILYCIRVLCKMLVFAEHDDHCEKIGLYIICKIQSLRTIKYHEDFCPECS